MEKRGQITIFYRKFVVSQYRKILVSKIDRDKRGGENH